MLLRSGLSPRISFDLSANCIVLELSNVVIFSDTDISTSDVQFSTRGHSSIFNEGNFLNNADRFAQFGMNCVILAAMQQAEKCRKSCTLLHTCHCNTLSATTQLAVHRSLQHMWWICGGKINSRIMHHGCGWDMTELSLGLEGSVSIWAGRKERKPRFLWEMPSGLPTGSVLVYGKTGFYENHIIWEVDAVWIQLGCLRINSSMKQEASSYTEICRQWRTCLFSWTSSL